MSTAANCDERVRVETSVANFKSEMDPNERHPMPILVVEDNLDDSFLLTRQLARADMDDCVTVIGNGKDAYDWLKAATTPPLAIFLDLKLPGMSGIELGEQIRKDPRLHLVPIIIMTGSVDPHDVEACTRLGVSAYLPKPVGLSTFIKIITHLFPKKAIE
jgi:two-component system response regulator